MATSTGKVFVDVYAQTAPAEKALQRIQKIANTPLNLNLKGGTYTGPLGKITGQVGEFDKSLEAANARVIAFGASAGIIYNAGKAFEYLVKTTIEVEKRLNDIKVILNTNTQAFSEFSSELFNIANRTGQTFNVATDAALELARQGLGLETTLKRTAAALSLTRISGLEVTKSVEAITAAINSFNKSAIDEINLVSKLSNVDTQFAVSSQDLAEALTRVGSTAQDAGVSIDELIGLVTAVQQTTSRGGPVIGNAFKTIFTRLSNSNTIEQLKALGVQIDETQSGLDKLRAISDAVKNVDESQANTIKRLAAGVYQINILSAVLSDLSNKYSIVSQAQNTATQSTNESEVRIRNLNKTLNGLINETINNFARLTSQIGENAVLPNADNFLRGINSAILTLTKDDASDAGFNFADAFFKGFGQFLTGPAFGLGSVLLLQLIIKLGKFAVESTTKLFQQSKELSRTAQLANYVNEALATQPSIIEGIRNRTISVAQAQELIITRLKEINNLRTIELGLINQTATTLNSRGFQIGKQPIGSKEYPTLVQQVRPSKTKSAGFIPNYTREVMTEKIGAYAGGYKPGTVKTTSIPKVGKVIYNSAEQVKKFPGFDQPAIMPPKNSDAGKVYRNDFIDKLGFDPYKNKAQGFVPNFLPTNILGPFRDTLKYIKDKKYKVLYNLNTDYPDATKSTVRGSYNPNNDTIKLLKGLEPFDSISTLAHEGAHRVIDKSKLSENIAQQSSRLFSKKKENSYGDLLNNPTIRRVLGAKDLYAPSSYLEEMLADISTHSINDKRQTGKLLGLITRPGELYPKTVRTAFKLSQRLIKASKQSLFSAEGFVPNFVPPRGNRLGSGAGASFFDLGKSFKGIPIGKKVFRDQFEAPTDVSREYAGFNLLKSANLPPFVGLPKFIGTEKRSVERGYIGKEVIKGRTRNQMADLFLDTFENKTGLSDRQNEAAYDFANAAEARLDHVLDKSGININDLRNGANVMFNDQFVETAKQLATKNSKFLENLIRSPRKLGQVLNAISKKRGAKVFPIDFELARKNKSEGFVPNFMLDFSKIDFSNPPLGEGNYASFYNANQSIRGIPVGFKKFKPQVGNFHNTSEDILKEFKLSKQLSKLNPKLKGIRFPEIFGDEQFTVGNRGIAKELITDPLPFVSIKQNVSKLKGPLLTDDINDIVQEIAMLEGDKFGFKSGDLHDENYTINNRGFDILNETIAQGRGQYGRVRSQDFESAIARFQNEGGIFNILDPGLFGSSDKLSKLVKSRPLSKYRNKGLVPNFALIPGISKLVGRAATNLVSPYGYSTEDKLAKLKQLKFKDYYDAIVKDKQVVKPTPFGDNSDDEVKATNAVRDFAFRKMFGLKPRTNIPENYFQQIKGEKNTYTIQNKYERKGIQDTILDQYRQQIKYNSGPFPVKFKKNKTDFVANNLSFGNFLVSYNKNKNRFSYKDRFDFDLHQGESFDLKKAYKELKNFISKKPAYLGTDDEKSPSHYRLGYGANNLTNTLRYLVSKITDPVTFKGGFKAPDEFKKLTQERDLFSTPFLNKGFIPNFNAILGYGSNALGAAVQREASAGIPKSKIKVGRHPSLKSPVNKLGLGVYNTLHEPLGLSQGVQRARKEGANPKKYGAAEGLIPNFANLPKKPRSLKVGVFDPYNLNPAFAQANQPQNFTQAALNKVQGVPFSKKNIEEINKRILEAAKRVGEFGRRWEKNPAFRKLETELQGFVANITTSKDAAKVVSKAFRNSVKKAYEYEQQLSAYNKALVVQEQRTNIKKDKLTEEASGLFVPKKRREAAIAELQRIGKYDPDIANRIESIRQNRATRSTQAGLGASFIIPILTSAISEAAGNATPGARKVSATADFAGSTLSTAALGLGITGGNPIGAIAGGIFGAGLGGSKFLNELRTQLPELEKDFEQVSRKLESFNNSFGQYIQSIEKYQGALNDASGAISPQDIEKFRKNTITKLLEIPPEFRSQVAAASGSIEQLGRTMGELSEKLGKSEKIQKSALALRQIFEETTNPFTLDTTVLDTGKTKEFTKNKKDISNILTTSIDPNEITKQASIIIKAAKDVQFNGGKGIASLLLSLKDLAKIPEAVVDQFKTIGASGTEDAVQLAKIIEEVVKSISETDKFTKIADDSRKSLVKLSAAFGREINDIQKHIAVLISSLSGAATQAGRSILTQNKLSRGREQFNVQRGITRLEGEVALQEPFLSDRAKNDLNNSIEEVKLQFDKLKTVQELVSDAQERGLEIFIDNISKAGSTLSELGQKAADRELTAEDTTTQQIAEKNIQNLTNVFRSVVEEIGKNPQKSVIDITKDKLSNSGLNESQVTDILSRNGDVLNKLRNDVLLVNEASKQNVELLRLNNQYQQAQLLQQKRLNQFGGIKSFIDRSSLDELGSLIREGASLRFGGNTQDKGIFSAKVLDNLTSRLGVSGEQLPKGLFDIAKSGRVESIKQDVDLAKIAAGLTGAFDSNQLDALEKLKDLAPEIADIQVRSLAKFDSLPTSALQIESQIITLNQQINDYLNSYVDKNELSFKAALDSSNISSHTDAIRTITQNILQSNEDIVALSRGREVASRQNELKNLGQNRQIQISNIGKDFTEAVKQLEINSIKLGENVNKNIPEDAAIEFAALTKRRRELTGNEGNVTKEDIDALLKFINTRGVNDIRNTVTKNIESNFIGRKDIADLPRPNISTAADYISQGKFETKGINTDSFGTFNDSITQLDARIKTLNDEIAKISEKPTRTVNDNQSSRPKQSGKLPDIGKNSSTFDLGAAADRQKEIKNTLAEQLDLINKKNALVQTELVHTRSIAEALTTIRDLNKETNEQYKIAIESLNKLEKSRLEREFAAAKVKVDELKASSTAFTDEIASAEKEANTLKARLHELTPGDLGTQFLDTWKYNFSTFQRDLNDGVYEIGYTMKDAFKEGFKEFIKGTKDADEALRDLALSVADKALDIATNIAFDQIFSAVGSGLGSAFSKKTGTGSVTKGATGGSVTKSGIKGYAEGGIVTGGSGKKDDVAAMLSPGEYVLRREAVQALTPELLDKLNEQKISTTTVKKLENGVDATFLNDLVYTKGPKNRPEEAKLIFDPNLSNFALTDEDNPQNSRRFQREEEFISYVRERLEYDKQKKEALRKYKRGQESSFYTQLIAAAASSAAGAYNQYGGQSSSNSLGRSNSDPRGLEPSSNADYSKIRRNSGGIIPRYANGGYHTDTMPALLTGGEYVVSRGAVRKYGTDFFERLNEMRFAEGGPVGYNSRVGINTDTDSSEDISGSIDRMSAATESLNTILGALSNINNNQNALVAGQNSPTNNVNITINVEDNGTVKATSTNNSENNTDNKDRKQTVEQTKALTQLIQTEVIKIITQQQRDGGLLANSRR